jgi:membrane protease YdiL (CAAX protease family)
VFFRGFLLPRFVARYGASSAIGMSAIYFGAVHFSAHAMVYATAAGYALGWAAYATRSTWSAICIHVGVNAAPLILTRDRVNIPGFNGAAPHAGHIPILWLACASVLGSLALFLMYKMARSQIRSTS